MTQRPLIPRGHQIPPAKLLARLLRNTIDDARKTGTDQRVNLSGGAEVVARVRDGQVLLTIKRLSIDVGATELTTFMRDAGVPDTAERLPAEGQYEREGWHFVTFRWTDGARASTKPEPKVRVDWSCGLCPAGQFPTFASGREMRLHAAEAHDLPLEQTERLKREAVMFLDGRRGSAQNVHNWVLDDGRILCTQIYSSGDFAEHDEEAG